MLLEIRNLTVAFDTSIVSNIHLAIAAGESVALLGKSGCGKSVTALAILRLLSGATVSGSVFFEGVDLLELSESAMAAIRGKGIGMVFQEPLSALNPIMTIGAQLKEGLRHHLKLSRRQAEIKSIHLLKSVCIDNANEMLRRYPHQLSGGQRQRVVIAMAAACAPSLVIADEPTTALDADSKEATLDVLQEACRCHGSGLLLITHDLSIAIGRCQRAYVMDSGTIVESGAIEEIAAHPQSPAAYAIVEASRILCP